MLTDQLGLPSVSQLFGYESERWDGKGLPNRVGGENIPMAVRIGQVARDAALQTTLGNAEFVADVIGRRAGGAFDPAIAQAFTDDAGEILDPGSATSLWDSTLELEPKPWSMLEGTEIDQALAAMGDFADMVLPELVGHSRGVSELAHAAAEVSFLELRDRVNIRRAALVHDLGRIAVPVRIWDKTDPLTSDDWERVRLHAYHTERILVRSPFLADLAPVASFHHERLDGSGYHRGVGSPSLDPPARLLATSDAYHAMTEPRPHRPALSPEQAARTLTEEAGKGTLASEAVAAVLEAAGHRRPPVERPAGLTDREMEVVRLLARGLQTKQIARQLGISAKTADYHIQNAYRKMGVATRAGATLYAMQHGLTTWENSR
jgi:HD-GYP domain-containing protein (c-di-GMP phosphodiesterase class II)